MEEAIVPRFEPASGMDVPRFAGIPTFMRLPHVPPEEAEGVEIGIFGVPFDLGTTNRPGARFGPRELRQAAATLRRLNQATGVDPFALAACADLGDAPVNPADLADSLRRIETFVDGVVTRGIVPLVAGGDHLTSLPVLRALARRHGPLGMVHFDAHTDFYDAYFGGFRYTHGTPFRRAFEEGLIDPKRVVQIGIRGTLYDGEDVAFARSVGVRVVSIEELVDRGFPAIASEARRIAGGGPVYVSFDIDAIDPAQAPGTGTPEVGGIDVHTAQRMIRLLDGLDLVGADLVEVSPPYDVGGITAWTGANLLFELLCVLAQAVARRRGAQGSG